MIFRRGLAGAELTSHDAPPDSLVDWGGWYPLPIPHLPRRLRRLDPTSNLAPHFSDQSYATAQLGVAKRPGSTVRPRL